MHEAREWLISHVTEFDPALQNTAQHFLKLNEKEIPHT